MRGICSGVFGERELHENEKVWREAVEQLTLLQFIIVEDDDPGIALVIRKDTYFDKVITDYPPHNQPKQIERDFTPLQRVFVELKDAEALSNLGIKLALLSRKKEALTAVDHALAFDLESPSMWQSKGMVCSLLGQVEEARAAFNRASKLDNKPKPDQFTEGARKVLLLADEEARRFQHNYIGTEHLLLGLIREKDGIAAKVLSALGVELNKVRAATEFIIGRGDRIIMGEIGLTPRAQKVIGLAADEARRLNHQYVGTEHLLLGIVREGGGIAVGVLESLGANLEKVRRQTLQALGLHDSPLMKRVDVHDWWRAAGRGGTAQQSEAPQLKETLDTTPRFYKFTEQARKVLLLADEEARRFQHNYIGTEHLLLGLIREKDGIAAKVLSALGVELNKVRAATEFIIGRGDRIIMGEIGLTPRAQKVIGLAADEARRLNHQYVGTEHLLLGIVREGGGIAVGVLESLGANLEKVRRQTLQALGLHDSPLMKRVDFHDWWRAAGRGGTAQQSEAPQLKETLDTTPRFYKFTEQAKKDLLLADEEARRFQHNYIGTEHLLLGLIREKDGIAAKVLSALGVELNKVRAATEFIIGRGDRIIMGEIGLTPRAKKVIEFADGEARRLNHQYVRTEHLLLGIVREGEGIAAGVLESLGANLEKVRRQTLQALDSHDTPQKIEEAQQIEEPQLPGLQIEEPQFKVPQLKEALEALESVLLEKEQAIQQQEYELAAQLHEREQELLDRIHALESIEIHLHRKHDNKK